MRGLAELAAYTRPSRVLHEDASLASEGTAFEARREAGEKRAARDGPVLLQVPVARWPTLLVGARLWAGVEESCQPGRERFLARVLRDVSLVG